MSDTVNVEALRRLNTDKNRTDVENLFLKEMVQEDQDIVVNEADDFAVNTIIPDELGDDGSLFGDSSSEDLDDIIDDEETGDLLDGFSMVEI